MDDENGVWRTINGARVFIRDGESVDDAIARLGEKRKRYSEHHVVMSKYWMAEVVPESKIEEYEMDGWAMNSRSFDADKYLSKLEDIDFADPKTTLKSILAELEDGDFKLNLRTAVMGEALRRLREAVPERTERQLAGIPKAKPTFVEDAALDINSGNYKKSIDAPAGSQEYAAYTLNCQRCVQAFVLRWLYGRDVTAKPYGGSWNGKKYVKGPIDEKLDRAGWEKAIFDKALYKQNTLTGSDIAAQMGRTNASTALQFKQINKIVSKAGPGACYICHVEWRQQTTRDGWEYKSNTGRSAHVFNIVNDNGTVKFIDPQSGKDASEYFARDRVPGIRPAMTKLTRVDGIPLDTTNLDLVVDYDREGK